MCAARLSGVKSQGLLKRVDRCVEIAALGQRRTQICISPRVLRIESDGLFELRDGAGQVGLSHQGNTQPVVRLGGIRSYLHGALEGLKRMRIVVPIPICQAESYMKLGIARIALDRSLNLAD